MHMINDKGEAVYFNYVRKNNKDYWVVKGIGSTVVYGRDRERRKSRHFTQEQQAERSYFSLLKWGCSPQEARSVLPSSLKTEVVMTANLREWRHFFKLRTAPAAHPQMREVAIPLLHRMQELIPVVFDDLEVPHEKS